MNSKRNKYLDEMATAQRRMFEFLENPVSNEPLKFDIPIQEVEEDEDASHHNSDHKGTQLDGSSNPEDHPEDENDQLKGILKPTKVSSRVQSPVKSKAPSPLKSKEESPTLRKNKSNNKDSPQIKTTDRTKQTTDRVTTSRTKDTFNMQKSMVKIA